MMPQEGLWLLNKGPQEMLGVVDFSTLLEENGRNHSGRWGREEEIPLDEKLKETIVRSEAGSPLGLKLGAVSGRDNSLLPGRTNPLDLQM